MTELYCVRSSDIINGQNLIKEIKKALKERDTRRVRQMLNEINDIFLNAKRM